MFLNPKRVCFFKNHGFLPETGLETSLYDPANKKKRPQRNVFDFCFENGKPRLNAHQIWLK